MKHGTRGAYNNGKCRCPECRATQAEYQRHYRARTAEQPIPPSVHGTRNGYNNYKCRCPECSAVQAAYQQRYRATRQEGVWTDMSEPLDDDPDAVFLAWNEAVLERMGGRLPELVDDEET